MYTLGYAFRPWRAPKAIADGPSILRYIKDTAADEDIVGHIRFRHRLTAAAWDSEAARWRLTVDANGATTTMQCRFLWMCSGYYSYEKGYTPDFDGVETFSGELVHPQQWPEGLAYKNKKVAIIGSGATAVTLLPAMAQEAAHTTLLQRSPTYMLSMPSTSALAGFLNKFAPAKHAYLIMRIQRVLMQTLFYRLSRAAPGFTKRMLLADIRKKLGEHVDVERHFSPDYKPWDQRLCLVPDDDFFHALRSGRASIVTDEVDRFTPRGVLLKSGASLEADIVVTATGLIVRPLAGVRFEIDGAPLKIGESLTYRGFMLENAPNLAAVFGYTNASWTLRADLIAKYVCRLLRFMDQRAYAIVRPRYKGEPAFTEPYLDFTSGYIKRAESDMPRQGPRQPWRNAQNYFVDAVRLRWSGIDDGALEFKAAREAEPVKL